MKIYSIILLSLVPALGVHADFKLRLPWKTYIIGATNSNVMNLAGPKVAENDLGPKPQMTTNKSADEPAIADSAQPAEEQATQTVEFIPIEEVSDPENSEFEVSDPGPVTPGDVYTPVSLIEGPNEIGDFKGVPKSNEIRPEADVAISALQTELNVVMTYANNDIIEINYHKFTQAIAQALFNQIHALKVNADIAMRDEEKLQLKNQLSAAKVTIEALSTEIAQKEESITELTAENLKLKDSLQAYDLQNLVTLGEVALPFNHYEIFPNSKDEFIHQVTQVLKSLEKLKVELDAANEMNVYFQQELKTSQAENRELIAEKSALTEYKRIHEEIKDNRERMITELRNELSKSEIRYNNLLSRVETDSIKNETLMKERDARLVEALNRIESLTSQIAKLSKISDSGVLMVSKPNGDRRPLEYDLEKIRAMITNVLQSTNNYSYIQAPRLANLKHVIRDVLLTKIEDTYQSVLPKLKSDLIEQSFMVDGMTFLAEQDHLLVNCQGTYTLLFGKSGQILKFSYASQVKLIPTQTTIENNSGFIITTIDESEPKRID